MKNYGSASIWCTSRSRTQQDLSLERVPISFQVRHLREKLRKRLPGKWTDSVLSLVHNCDSESSSLHLSLSDRNPTWLRLPAYERRTAFTWAAFRKRLFARLHYPPGKFWTRLSTKKRAQYSTLGLKSKTHLISNVYQVQRTLSSITEKVLGFESVPQAFE